MQNRGALADRILVIGQVRNSPNQIRYQRVLSLAKSYPLYVVTTSPLPACLESEVREVHLVGRWFSMLHICMLLMKRLGARGEVVVHTVYAPRPLIAGFLCRAMYNCRWVYDLFDHPSLTWSASNVFQSALKKGIWIGILSRMLRLADVWVVGMHPAVLSHLPVPRTNCQIIFSGGPGIQDKSVTEPDRSFRSELSICYAGALSAERGLGLIAAWARNYEGPKASLHLMGRETNEAVASIEAIRDEAEQRGLRIFRHGWTVHDNVLRILKRSDIGLCPIDPAVLNYRYAYPIKVIEYMSLGLIPVATDGHGVRALLRHCETGFIARYNNESFAKAISEAIRVCQQQERRDALVREMYKSVEGRNWGAINSRLLADIESALTKAI